MLLYEELTLIIPKDVARQLFNFELRLLSSTNKSSKNTKFVVGDTDRSVTIFVNTLSPKESAQLKKVLRKEFDKGGALFVEKQKSSLLDRLYEYNDSKDNQILEFFKKILSNNDYLVLRDALFLRSEFKKGININLLKTDIKSRFGERGNVITNLCTAGYFEEVMIPLITLHKTQVIVSFMNIMISLLIEE